MPTRIILDVDTGTDDAVALTLRVFDLIGRSDVPANSTFGIPSGAFDADGPRFVEMLVEILGR